MNISHYSCITKNRFSKCLDCYFHDRSQFFQTGKIFLSLHSFRFYIKNNGVVASKICPTSNNWNTTCSPVAAFVKLSALQHSQFLKQEIKSRFNSTYFRLYLKISIFPTATILVFSSIFFISYWDNVSRGLPFKFTSKVETT